MDDKEFNSKINDWFYFNYGKLFNRLEKKIKRLEEKITLNILDIRKLQEDLK